MHGDVLENGRNVTFALLKHSFRALRSENTPDTSRTHERLNLTMTCAVVYQASEEHVDIGRVMVW